MIGKISGRVDYVAEDHALIDTGGVGYVVHCATRTLGGLRAGETAALYTELSVREDAMQLFGFATLADREWHRLLTSVQGVGARLGLAILGTLGAESVGRALALGDAGAIRKTPGVGPKLAERIVRELKDRAPAVIALGAQGARAAAPGPSATGPAPAVHAAEAAPDGPMADRAGAMADALSALANLGYASGEAAQALAEVEGDAAPELIRGALKRLGPKG